MGAPPRQRSATVTVPSSALCGPRSSQLPPAAPLLQRTSTSDHCRLRNHAPDTPSETVATFPNLPQTGLARLLCRLARSEAFHILPSGAWSRFARRRLTYSTTATVHPSLLPHRLGGLRKPLQRLTSSSTSAFTILLPAKRLPVAGCGISSFLRTAEPTAPGSYVVYQRPSPTSKFLRFIHHSATHTKESGGVARSIVCHAKRQPRRDHPPPKAWGAAACTWSCAFG